MNFDYYNELITPPSLENFLSSLNKSMGFTFNSLLNIFQESGLKYEIIEGFCNESEESNYKLFNKIKIKIENDDKFKKLCEEFDLNNTFDIKQTNDIYIICVIDE